MTEPTPARYLLIQAATTNSDLPDPGCALVTLSPEYLATMTSQLETARISQFTIGYDDAAPDLCDFTVDYSWPDYVRGAFQIDRDIRHFAVVCIEDLPGLTRSDLRVRLTSRTVNSQGQVQWIGERGDVKVETLWIAWVEVMAAIDGLAADVEGASLMADPTTLLCEP